MFALDNLLRKSVQYAIMVLSPEYGANIVEPTDRDTSSGASTYNSQQDHPEGGELQTQPHVITRMDSYYNHVHTLEEENRR